MSVITICRESFAGGKKMAESLTASLGYRLVDREVIVERAAAHGVSQEELLAALEKPPTLMERVQHKKYLYLALIQAALCEEVRTGQVVYYGNAGHLLLKGGPHILRVRLIAPLDFRTRMAQDRLKLSPAEALDHVERLDQKRRKWAQYLYGVAWDDPANYDIVLNLEVMNTSEACETVATLARQHSFDFTPSCRTAMEDMALASRVRAELALDAATSGLEVSVEAVGGAVSVHGAISVIPEAREVRRVVANVPGVVSLVLDELASPVRA